ncbi:unnamed protein product [Lactuca saligna]|uniref:Uncharacterized protein n=1 Tax=Lactuca saligna TaxID=75948 RepID=A0AA36E9F9_LACSI|nr:unnamed protein product [Lactuca saligna]
MKTPPWISTTHGAIFMSPRYGRNSFGAFGGGGGGGGGAGGGGGLHEFYNASQNMTAMDVMRQYKELEDDVSSIEAGFYLKYGYNSNTSPFTLEWGNNNKVDGFLSPPPYGARGKRSYIVVVAVVAAGWPLEQERKKGVP